MIKTSGVEGAEHGAKHINRAGGSTSINQRLKGLLIACF